MRGSCLPSSRSKSKQIHDPRLRRHGSTGREMTRIFFHLRRGSKTWRPISRSFKGKRKKEGRKRKPPRRHTFSTIVNKGRRERDDSLKRNLRGKQDSRFIVRATRNRPQRYLHAHAPCAWRNSFLGPRSFFNKRGPNRSGRAKVEHR